MIVYMLRKKDTDLYYKRTSGKGGTVWVPQSEASIWTHRRGPIGASNAARKRSQGELDLVIEHYQMQEVMHEPI
jgi:hypothetical protein